jgi:hypothetical protein
MKRICQYQLAAAFLVCIGIASAQTTTCPAFVHKANITQYVDSGATLPVAGTVVAGAQKGGLYTSPLGKNTPTLVPNTQGDHISSTQITEDGQWVLYNAGGPVLIRIDGQYRTKVPVTASGSDGCCTFWWNAPSGKLEVVYRASGDKIVHAIPVTLSANAAPTFGTDHTIAQFNEAVEFSMGVSGTHFWSRIDDAEMGPEFVTIPDNGNGIATDANIWKHTVPKSWGCKCTISHDGSICLYNPGYDQWCGCLCDEFCLLRHKSFALVPFQEQTAPSLAWQTTLLKTMAVSVNWAPRKYLFLSSTDSTKGASAGTSNFWSDFKDWCYTNDNNYVAGDLDCLPYKAPDSCAGSHMPDSGTIWLVHYPTNTWTMILRLPAGQRLAYPAVWIKGPTSTMTPLYGNRLEYRGVPLQGNNYMVDIRGRILTNVGSVPKLIPGIYYSVTPNGQCRRIAVSH